MSWFRCDDQLADHPKVVALGTLRRPALGLWTMCGTYCARHLTDGYVPREIVTMYADRDLKKLTDALVRSGLFDEVPGGWVLHDYLDWNPSRAEVMEKRAKVQASGRRGGLAKARANAIASAIADASVSLEKAAYSRPDPYPLSPANAGDAREISEVELAVRRLRHGNASIVQVETMEGFVEQLDEATVLRVLAECVDEPKHDRYGIAQDRLREMAARKRKRRGGDYGGAVIPLTNYDRVIVTDEAGA